MTIYDDIEAEGRLLFPEQYASDRELRDIVERGKRLERLERESEESLFRFGVVVFALAVVACIVAAAYRGAR